MNLYVSRYSNPALKSGKFVTIGISLSGPRFALGHTVSKSLRCLAPSGDMQTIEDYETFRNLYIAKLDSSNAIEEVQSVLSGLTDDADVVFLCFEDIRKEGVWCHRTIFADWFSKKTSVSVFELRNPSEVKYTATERKLLTGRLF